MMHKLFTEEKGVTAVLLVFAIIATVYLLMHFPVAMYIRHKNPSVKISVGPVVYITAVVLWAATIASHVIGF